MKKDDLKSVDLPDLPGVYFFLGNRKEVLYIGKATSLKQRVKSYFAADLRQARSPIIEQMVAEASSIECVSTDSVLEALILEANLIRSHKPKYNTRSKDDKSYNHLIITDEEWPRVLVVRGKDITEKYLPKEIKYHFGPFPSGQQLRDALRIIRKLFRFYDTGRPIGKEHSRVSKGMIDFNRQIGLYPEAGDKVGYARTIRHLKLLFQGQKTTIIKELEREMHQAANLQEFEKANLIKKQIFALQHIEDVALIKHERSQPSDATDYRIEAYDVAHLSGQSMVGVMVVIENDEPVKSEYRRFKIRSISAANDPAALREIVERRFTHPEWPFPQLVVVDGNQIQKKTAELLLHRSGLLIPVVAVTKNKQHKPEHLIGPTQLIKQHQSAILLANAEAHRFSIGFHRRTQRKHALK